MTPPPRIAVITCAVLELEINHYRQGLGHVLHVETLEQGLHNEPEKLRRTLQEAVTRIETQFPAVDAIVLGYGLCSRGTEGVTTRRCKLVMPRAHDCITVLLGSKEGYAAYVKEHPGTYWYSPGWNKCHIPPGKERYDKLYQQYVAKYGEDNAAFLMETEQQWFTAYSRATYVDLGVGATEADLQYTRDCAAWLKWSFDHQHGDPSLLLAMLRGEWDASRFVVVEPGQTWRMTADEQVVETIDPPHVQR
jgi:hypothetical protein